MGSNPRSYSVQVPNLSHKLQHGKSCPALKVDQHAISAKRWSDSTLFMKAAGTVSRRLQHVSTNWVDI